MMNWSRAMGTIPSCTKNKCWKKNFPSSVDAFPASIICTAIVHDDSAPRVPLHDRRVQLPPQIVRLMAVGKSSLAGDSIRPNKLAQRLIHRHHAFTTRNHDLRTNLMVVTLADQVAHCKA